MKRATSNSFRWSLAALFVAAIAWVTWAAWQITPRPVATELATLPRTTAASPNAAQQTASAKAHKSRRQPDWGELQAAEQNALRPLAQQWDQLPARERKSLLASAKRYSAMSKKQQERYTSRLVQWSKMTPGERDLARKRYAAYSKSKKEARLEIERLWKEQQSKNAAAPREDATPATVTALPVTDTRREASANVEN